MAAATLELARLLKGHKLRRTVRFVFFVNEEPPYFQTEPRGSFGHAHQLRRDRIPVAAMISLETFGFYSDGRGRQKYPALAGLFYPSRGNFIAFVGNDESGDLVRLAVRRFRESARFRSEGIAGPPTLPDVGWSDHRSFWQEAGRRSGHHDHPTRRCFGVRTITPLSTRRTKWISKRWREWWTEFGMGSLRSRMSAELAALGSLCNT